MTALGLGLAWGGYLIFTYGYTLVRGYSMTLSDLALPTHRQATLAAIIVGPQSASWSPQMSTTKYSTTPGSGGNPYSSAEDTYHGTG